MLQNALDAIIAAPRLTFSKCIKNLGDITVTDKRLNMPTSVAQIIMQFTQAGQVCENVLYAQKEHSDAGTGGPWATAPMDGGAADQIASDVGTWATGQWGPTASSTCVMTGLQIIWNTAAGTGPLSGKDYATTPFPVSGSNSGEALPNVNTKAISIRTASLGRHYHGRVYFVGLCDAHIDPSVDANVLRSTAISDLTTAYEHLRTSLHADHGVALLLDRYNIGVMALRHADTNLVPGIFTPATNFSIRDPYVDTMRRRLPGHNRHG